MCEAFLFCQFKVMTVEFLLLERMIDELLYNNRPVKAKRHAYNLSEKARISKYTNCLHQTMAYPTVAMVTKDHHKP